MNNQSVKIQYIFHSGFSVQTVNCFLIFDYYKGHVDLNKPDLANKKMYVFSSHSHGDHFNNEIFKWSITRPDIKYILSSDIKDSIKDIANNNQNTIFISPYQKIKIDNLNIKAFGSTDIGISFLVDIDDLRIFHAGDLNWWAWPDDTPEEAATMRNAFTGEISKIKKYISSQEIDIAFFPVDPRLENNYYMGGEYFIKEISPKHLFPMHFGVSYETTGKFAQYMSDLKAQNKIHGKTRIFTISNKGQEFFI
ncbi:MAG TPA: MBL fold metallo-hydrolase [Clostridiaceae bacterium]|nr:MBL fold metallo-hydrolase [Clostridiaceae bacterium]